MLRPPTPTHEKVLGANADARRLATASLTPLHHSSVARKAPSNSILSLVRNLHQTFVVLLLKIEDEIPDF